MIISSVNVARSVVARPYASRPTAIDKTPVAGRVEVREPGSKRDGLGSGLVGDHIGDRRHHGGTEQAVYAFARERLDDWQALLGRELSDGCFGENLTTLGVDVDGALIGERWRIGPDVVLQVTCPRIPCRTFRGWTDAPGWLRRFTADSRPGAYLSVVTGGFVGAGDAVEVVHRPAHGVTITQAFRAVVRDAALLPELREAWDYLGEDLRATVESGRTISIGV